MRSWLALERLALGEIQSDATVANDPVATARLRQIREEKIALAPLDFASTPARVLTRVSWRERVRWYWLSLAVAPAALAFFLWPAPNAVKGGDLALYLVRERDGSIAYDGDVFSPGDRFKLALTCPPGESLDYRVHVRQDGNDSEPFAPGHIAECGNHIALPGALVLDGASPAAICVESAKGRPCVVLRPASK